MRISEKDYYFKVVEAVALRGTCDRGRSGAILVKDRRIIATGYVGAPAKLPDCDTVGHELRTIISVDKSCLMFSDSDGKVAVSDMGRMTTHCVRTVHAELNAILQAARKGPSAEGAVLYCTMFPCRNCAMAIINVGIVGVYAHYDYQRSQESKDLLDRVKIPWVIENYKTPGYEDNK